MAQELYANDSATVVTAGGTIAGTIGTIESWMVTSSASFPFASNAANPPTQFHVADPAAPSEMVTVTNVAGTIGATWTVTRGAENTTPVVHAPGFTAIAVLTAGDLGSLATYTGDLALTAGTTQVISTHLGSPMPVAQGGIGVNSLTTYGVIAAGTATTSPVQQVAPGSAGQVLTAIGAGTLPSFQPLPAASTGGSGIIQIDGTTTDITVNGTQAAGSSGLAGDAKHVHPSVVPFSAIDAGWQVWNGDIATSPASNLMTNFTGGVLFLARLNVRAAVTVSKIAIWWVQPTGGTPANSFLALFNSAGVQVGSTTSDLTSTATGIITPSIGSQPLSAGIYFSACLIGTQGTATAGGPLYWGSGPITGFAGGSAFETINQTPSTYRWAKQGSGLSAMPGTVNYSSNTTSVIPYWCALA